MLLPQRDRSSKLLGTSREYGARHLIRFSRYEYTTVCMELLDRRKLKPRVRHDLMRLGLPKDGGYVVPAEAVQRTAVLLSFGLKQDWSFEVAFLAVNSAVRVIGVDPSVGPRFFARQVVAGIGGILRGAVSGNRRQCVRSGVILRNSLHYFWFFGLQHRHLTKLVANGDGPGQVTVHGLMELAAETEHRVFLKMDIEGAEYGVISDILQHHASINCIVAEFHRVGKCAVAFNNAIAALQQQFQIVHIHGNNYRPYDTRHDFPETVEVTFLNSALMTEPLVEASCEYPQPGLDFPNLPSRPDHRLRFD